MTSPVEGTFCVRNRQRTRRVSSDALRRIGRAALQELAVSQWELCVHLVGAAEMERVNLRYLQHEGSTDIITFNHLDEPSPSTLHGELYICVDEAVAQAAEFGTTWQEELARYLVHGLLHLQGFDDLEPGKRRVMKARENALVRHLKKRFVLEEIAPAGPAVAENR